MSESAAAQDTGDEQKPSGQLATPALSPISEHGEVQSQPFPGLEEGDETVTAKEGRQKDGRTDLHGIDMPLKMGQLVDGLQQQQRRRSSASSPRAAKLSPIQLRELVSSPENIPVRSVPDGDEDVPSLSNGAVPPPAVGLGLGASLQNSGSEGPSSTGERRSISTSQGLQDITSITSTPGADIRRPSKPQRSASTPLVQQRKHSSSKSSKTKPQLSPLKVDGEISSPSPTPGVQPSPMPATIPVPPLSLPVYLQLELSSDRPSPLYIHRSATSDFPYESSKVKVERLKNFFYVPKHLEAVLWFGAIACLDAWLYTFTILPLRFLNAVWILLNWMGGNAAKEVQDLGSFVYAGIGRVWRRRRESSVSESRRPSIVDGVLRKTSVSAIDGTATSRLNGQAVAPQPAKKRSRFGHRRTKSTPSALRPNHKADILQGMLIILSCSMLTYFDASRMYHSIRGQAAIKLYVIYNVLEVFDRLFSALGQDVLECLFSKETLERDEHGRSKLLRPLWMFCVALAYNVIHATALFYQVVTLNVAVNSYSNALLTLLMSNQLVEIKGTVFKKFEKENLFQLTCADVVERFQLWLMLLIIAFRNIVEVGGLSISLNSAFSGPSSPTDGSGIPLTSGFSIPKAFTLFPKWTGEVLGPFLIVLGSEMLVDWCKHAYITKFNNVKPNIYGRFLDVIAKDYYSHAFADQNLTKRLGLPVIPLSCLFIRACMQTYHMFIATYMPMPMPTPGRGVSVESEAAATSPATMAAFQHVDQVFRRALGRSSFGGGGSPTTDWTLWTIDDAIALATMCIFFLVLYFVLLAFKLLLGIALLSLARSRYKGMKMRERESVDAQGRRVGGWGVVEVGEEKRRWIYDDDPDGLKELRDKEERGRKAKEKDKSGGGGTGLGAKLEGVQRYGMAGKRIW